jgi:hypothetical protein
VLLVVEELQAAIGQLVVVRECDARLEVALLGRIGTALGDHHAFIGQ